MALVVCAETNILGYLNRHKIYPDYFYTDLAQFETDVLVMQDVDILIIVTGGCEFQRRKLFGTFNMLRGLIGGEFSGVKSVEILSDLQLPQVEDYYRYFNGDLFNYQHTSGWKSLSSDGGFKLTDYRSEPKPCTIILSKKDEGDSEKYVNKITKMRSKDEEYREIILARLYK